MSENPNGKTMTYSISQLKELETKQALTKVYNALMEKGYNYNNARAIIAKLDRDELLKILVASYLAD